MHETEDDRRLRFRIVHEKIGKAAQRPKPISRRHQLQLYAPEFRPRLQSMSGHYRIWTCLVVGDRLELVSFREKAAQLRINAGSSATSLRNCPWTPL